MLEDKSVMDSYPIRNITQLGVNRQICDRNWPVFHSLVMKDPFDESDVRLHFPSIMNRAGF